MADKIMLVDGNSLINRGFYAMPLLTNKDGEYTNGVFGFLNIFFRLFAQYSAWILCCMLWCTSAYIQTRNV